MEQMDVALSVICGCVLSEIKGCVPLSGVNGCVYVRQMAVFKCDRQMWLMSGTDGRV